MYLKLKTYLDADLSRRELLRGTSVALVLKVAGKGMVYLFALVVAHTLGATGWGVFTLALAYVSVGVVLGLLGLDTALLRIVAEQYGAGQRAILKPTMRKVMSLVLMWATCIAVGAYYAAPYVAIRILGNADLVPAFQAISFAIPALAIGYLAAETLRGLKAIAPSLMIRDVLRLGIPLLLFVLILPFYLSPQLTIYVFVAGAFIGAGIGLIWVHRRLNQIHEEGGVAYPMKPMFRLSFPLLLASSMMFIKGWIDTIMVGYFMTEADVGIYNIAYKVAALTSIVLMAVNSIAAPQFATLFGQKDWAGLEKSIQRTSRLLILSAMPVFVGLMLFPTFVLGLFGAEFEAGAVALGILAIGMFINAVAGSVGVFLQMTGGQVTYQNIVLTTTLLSVVLNVILIPRFGINGAAISTAITLAAFNVVSIGYIKKRHNILTLYNPFRSIA